MTVRLVESNKGAPPRRLKPGDIVQMLTGGPKMVVGSYTKDGKGGMNCDYVDCHWISNGLASTGGVNTVQIECPWSKVLPVTVLKKVSL